jgi:hypothetical protein
MRENEFWGYVGHYPPGSLKGDDDHTIDGRCAAQNLRKGRSAPSGGRRVSKTNN